MHDHNLDDLIIGNIEPENGKTKSFLTIIALLIVVMIVAIILTKILLKTPDTNKLAIEENMTEMIAPELKLQEAAKEEKTENEPSLSSIVESEISPPAAETKDLVEKEDPDETVKEEVPPSNTAEEELEAPHVETKSQVSEAEQSPIVKEQMPEKAAEESVEETAEETTEETVEITKEYTQTPAQIKKPVVTPDVPKIIPSQTYYIQVGSFTQDPSERFLSAIKNSGFSYSITSATGSGSRKLLIGPYKDKPSADSALSQVKDRINKSAFIIKK